MKTLVILSLCLVSLAQAGEGGSTGGGTGVVNREGKSTLLDLEEEETDFNQDLVEFDPTKEKVYASEILKRLDQLESRMPGTKMLALEKFESALKSTKFYFTDKPLPASNDTCLFVKVPSLSQAALQHEGKVVVYRPWYKQADDKNKAGLLNHEIVMLIQKRPPCSDDVRLANRAFMNMDKRSVNELADQFFVKGLGIYHGDVYDSYKEASFKHKMFMENGIGSDGALGRSLKEFCAYEFDFTRGRRNYNDEDVTMMRKFQQASWGYASEMEDQTAMRHPPISKEIVGRFMPRISEIIDQLEQESSRDKDWKKCNTPGSRAVCSAALKKIQQEECKLYQTWKESDRPFHELAREIRQTTKPDESARPNAAGSESGHAGDRTNEAL